MKKGEVALGLYVWKDGWEAVIRVYQKDGSFDANRTCIQASTWEECLTKTGEFLSNLAKEAA